MPDNLNNPTLEPVLSSQETGEAPAAPPNGGVNLAATVPPLETLNNPTPPPNNFNSPMPATPPSPPPMVPRRGGFPKKLLIIVLLLLLLGIGGFAIVKMALPNLGAKEASLTWWGLWEDDQSVLSLIAEYQAAHPNVKIKYERQSQQDYRERLTNSLARGNGPDIFRIHNTWVPMFRNYLSPLPNSVMTPSEYAQTFFPVASTDLSNGRSLVAIPLEFDSIALFINEEIFETFAKSPPTTWDDLRQLALELTVKDENGAIRQAGVALGRTENVDHWPEILGLLMLQNKVKMTNPTGKLAEDALGFYTRFATSDGVWDETLPSSTIAFAGGKVAMYLGPSWRVHEIKEQNPSLRFRVVPAPQLPQEGPADAGTYYATYWAEGVWSESKGSLEAWNFLKYMSTKESLEKFYQAAITTGRLFGEPYPRVDMAGLLTSDPLVGAFVLQGKDAKSWYLASRTFDGPTGINSQINKYFEDAVNAVNAGDDVKRALATTAAGVTTVLSQYGLVAPAPTPK